jgi:uncharacterized protein (DUF2461 family)
VRAWFTGLEANNTKEYFAANRTFYEQSVRGQMEALLGRAQRDVRRPGQELLRDGA